MDTITTITSQWQVYIPLSIREKLNLVGVSQAKIDTEDDKIVIIPISSSLLKMAGKYKHLKPIKPINLDKIRDSIEYDKL